MTIRFNTFRAMQRDIFLDPVVAVSNHVPKVVTRCTAQPDSGNWVHLIITGGTHADVAKLQAENLPVEIVTAA